MVHHWFLEEFIHSNPLVFKKKNIIKVHFIKDDKSNVVPHTLKENTDCKKRLHWVTDMRAKDATIIIIIITSSLAVF